MMNGLLEVKGETKLECVHKCQEREDMYDYVTKIHEVTMFKKIFKYNAKQHAKNQYAGVAYQKYYRAIMKLKPKGEGNA